LVCSPEAKCAWQQLLAMMNEAATIISARVRAYLTRRAYLGAARAYRRSRDGSQRDGGSRLCARCARSPSASQDGAPITGWRQRKWHLRGKRLRSARAAAGS
jgi:hypothetical protein